MESQVSDRCSSLRCGFLISCGGSGETEAPNGVSLALRHKLVAIDADYRRFTSRIRKIGVHPPCNLIRACSTLNRHRRRNRRSDRGLTRFTSSIGVREGFALPRTGHPAAVRTDSEVDRLLLLDAQTRKRATEVERSGNQRALEKAAGRLKSSGKPQRVLQVPEKDMSKATKAMQRRGVSGTVKNMSGTKRRGVSSRR